MLYKIKKIVVFLIVFIATDENIVIVSFSTI